MVNAGHEISRNIAIHDRIAARYFRRHGDIFNEHEQRRLREGLSRALAAIRGVEGRKPRALDFGSGIGNLTQHLIGLGAETIAADVSPRSLQLVADAYGVETITLNGKDLAGVPDARFDLVATYSVLHHVPDYLGAVREMVRVVRPGGIIFIDHENCPSFWNSRTPEYAAFLARVRVPRWKWRRLSHVFQPNWYLYKVQRFLNPRFQEEGDIHVWPDDHVDWCNVSHVLERAGAETLVEQDYLLFKEGYPFEVWRKYSSLCADMRMLIARKNS